MDVIYVALIIMLISNENVAKLIPGKLEPLNPERLAKEDEFNFIVSI